jgi:acetyl-CoA C-acetyltransferase
MSWMPLIFYGSFSIAAFITCEALGWDIQDPRGLTVTGGMPFFHGPGTNYSMLLSACIH